MDTELANTFSVRPIGFMKSVFHFKNGTPRQPSLCQSAKGVLLIEKSVFNNPEHSLEGLHEFSYAWIIFLFHKNDNDSFNKAKVKPPRLNGRRVGVFSSRSPYRPNNIGLSLAKIDKIDGAAIHVSGIDILDGTPVLDVKPYIPEYDTPGIPNGMPDRDDKFQFDCDGDSSDFVKCKVNDISYPCANELNDTNTVQSNGQDVESYPHSLSSTLTESLLLNSNISDKEQLSEHVENECAFETTGTNSGSSENLSQGFYALSAVLNKAGSEISTRSNQNDFNEENLNPREQQRNSANCDSFEDTSNSCGNSGTSQINSINDHLLDYLVSSAISKAVSDLGQSEPSETCCHPGEKVCDFEENEPRNVNEGEDSPSELDEGKIKLGKSASKGENIFKNGESNHQKSNIPVTAPWLSCPPVHKLRVNFTPDALRQLRQFNRDSSNEKYRLQMFSDSEEAKVAISSILHEEPRSIYRRQHCQDKLYFFVLDVLHVTSWFDDDSVQVVRIKPVKDVSFLQK